MWRHGLLRFARNDGERAERAFPSPLVGEGGSSPRSGGETDEGSLRVRVCVCGENPSSGASRHLLHKGRREERRRIRAHHCVISCVTARRANHLKPVQSSHQKYSASRSPQITRTTPPIPRPQEGRIAIVTDVGCGERWPQSAGRAGRFSQGGLRSVSEGRAPTNGVDADGKAVWSWRPLLASSRRRFCKSNRVCQNLQSAGDGGKRNSSPGRARYKP